MKTLPLVRHPILVVITSVLIVCVLSGIFFYTHQATSTIRGGVNSLSLIAATPDVTAITVNISQQKKSPTPLLTPTVAVATATIPAMATAASAQPTTAAAATTNAPPLAPGARDPLQWPFASNSIWNMPIGANASYIDTAIGLRGFGTDIDWFVTKQASDPLVAMYTPPTFGQGRCVGTAGEQQAQWHPEASQSLHVPSDLIIPDAITSGGVYWTPNSSAAFLVPDRNTVIGML